MKTLPTAEVPTGLASPDVTDVFPLVLMYEDQGVWSRQELATLQEAAACERRQEEGEYIYLVKPEIADQLAGRPSRSTRPRYHYTVENWRTDPYLIFHNQMMSFIVEEIRDGDIYIEKYT